MPLIHLPFLKGQDQTIDPKIAPLGVLKSAKNVRFTREGRIVKRPGYVAHETDGTAGYANIGVALFAFLATSPGVKALFDREGEKVAVAGHRVCSYSATLGSWRDWGPITPWAAPERYELARNLAGRTYRPSVAHVNGYACVTFESSDTVAGATRVYACIYDLTTMTMVGFHDFGAGLKRPRVVAMGNFFVVVYLDATPAPDVLMFTRLSTTAITSGWSAPVVISTGFALTAEHFDLCAYDATNTFLCHVAAANIVVCKISSGGALALGAFGAPGTGVPTIYADSSLGAVMACWLTAAGALTVRSWNGSLGSSVGPTVISTFAGYTGQPTVGPESSTAFRVTISRDDAIVRQEYATFSVSLAAHVASSSSGGYGNLLASKPLDAVGSRWCWAVNKSNFDRTYYLRSLGQNGSIGTQAQLPGTLVARGTAVAMADAGAHLPELISYTSGGKTYALSALPVVVDSDASSATPMTGVDLVRVELEGTERFQGTVVGGNLYLSGGLLSMFDGALAHEVSFLDEPVVYSLVAGAVGSLTPSSTYQYLATRHWLDANGLLHLSGVSDPVSVALGAGQNSVTIQAEKLRQTWRRQMWRDVNDTPVFNVHHHIWRTEANGSIFYQVTPEGGVSLATTSGGDVFHVDTLADSAIRSKAIIYTQGVRGGLSGPLQHDPPPPCKYIWAGKERVIIGGLETRGEVRWSKFFFPGEALEFSEDIAFRKLVPGVVRAVAALDDVWVVFTDRRIYTITGAGPDDTGVGAFDEPRPLPSDVGIIGWKSLVEWSGGLFFQGKAGTIHLLPRGIGSPVPQAATESVLATYPTVESAVLHAEQNLVVFTLSGGAGSTGALLCFDTTNGQWVVDEVATGTEHAATAVVGGSLLLATKTGDAMRAEDATVSTDGASTFVAMQLETAWLRPHGMQAAGRTRKVAVLGENVATCNLKMELAIDDSPTYAYSKQWLLSAADVGLQLRREWDVPVQKFGSCAIRITELQQAGGLNAGFVLHGLSLEAQGRPGMPRLRQGHR